jgi:hypothetical protein
MTFRAGYRPRTLYSLCKEPRRNRATKPLSVVDGATEPGSLLEKDRAALEEQIEKDNDDERHAHQP